MGRLGTTPYQFDSPSRRGRVSYAWSSRPTRGSNGTTRGAAAQAGARYEDAATAGAASPDRVAGRRGASQRAHRRATGGHASDGAQVASTVVTGRRPAACRRRGGAGLGPCRIASARSWPTHPGAVVQPISFPSRSWRSSPSRAKIQTAPSDRSAIGRPGRWPVKRCGAASSRTSRPDPWIVF